MGSYEAAPTAEEASSGSDPGSAAAPLPLFSSLFIEATVRAERERPVTARGWPAVALAENGRVVAPVMG